MPLTAKFAEALQYAFELHALQRRKGTDVPYVAHLLEVAAIALEYGADEDEAIAALLHDAVEDQGGPAVRAQIARRFGARVAEIVDGCTDADTIPKPPWRERKEAFLARLAGADHSVQLIVAADKLHNARSLVRDYRALGESLWARFNGGRDGTLWYYRGVVATLKSAPSHPALIEELARVVEELEQLADA